MYNDKVCVIIVLFHPSKQQINKITNILIEKKKIVILVDNTPNTINNQLLLAERRSNIFYLPQQFNKGIAEAQNIGVNMAKGIKGITHVLLLDQDSVIDDGFIEEMMEEYFRISNNGIKISALGPTPVNENNHKEYKQESISEKKRGQGFIMPSMLISSGMLISLKTIFDVGLMENKLFIDFVDFEWCWRAKSKGYVCCMTENIKMTHKVGIQDKLFLGYPILVSIPERYYYQYRNYFILFKRSYVPIKWKIINIIKKLFFFFYIPLFTTDGKKSFRYIIKGIRDGLTESR